MAPVARTHLRRRPHGHAQHGSWRAWYLRQMAENPGSTQPGKAYRLARAMLNTAVEDGLLRTNPWKVKVAGAQHAEERPVAMPGQVAKLVEAVHPKYRTMVLLAAYCSLRFGELAGLRRRRIDLLHHTVTVEETAVELAGGRVVFGPPKTAASRRVVSLPPELVQTLEQHLADHVGPRPDALVFTDLDDEPLGRQRFRPLWAAACAGAKINGLHFHDLRGSGAS